MKKQNSNYKKRNKEDNIRNFEVERYGEKEEEKLKYTLSMKKTIQVSD